MLSGGRSLHYFREMAGDEKNSVVIVGYQAEGTLGRKLTQIKKGQSVWGGYGHVRVNAEIFRCSFSAHADNIGLLSLMHRLNAKQFILVHGAIQAKRTLRRLFEHENKEADVILPEKGKRNRTS